MSQSQAHLEFSHFEKVIPYVTFKAIGVGLDTFLLLIETLGVLYQMPKYSNSNLPYRPTLARQIERVFSQGGLQVCLM